jgi:hypothetical protein
MAIENDFPPTGPGAGKRLVLLQGGKTTVYTSPAKARKALRRLTLGGAIAATSVAAWTLGAELLGRVAGVLFLAALVGLAAWLVVDTLRSLR